MIKVMLISIALYIYFFLIKNIQDRLKNTDKQYDVAIVYLFSLLHPKIKMLSLICDSWGNSGSHQLSWKLSIQGP